MHNLCLICAYFGSICAYFCVHVCLFVLAFACMFACLCLCLCLFVLAFLLICIRICTSCACICVYLCLCVCVLVFTWSFVLVCACVLSDMFTMEPHKHKAAQARTSRHECASVRLRYQQSLIGLDVGSKKERHMWQTTTATDCGER